MFAVAVGGRGIYQTVPNEVEHTIENPDVECTVEKERLTRDNSDKFDPACTNRIGGWDHCQ